MVKKSRARKSTIKRKSRSVAAATRAAVVSGELNKQQWPISKAARMNLRYNDFLKLTSTTGSVVSNQFRMNSPYDVDYSYTGHQPYGYDQISGLYNYVCVIRFTIHLRYTALTAAMRVVIEPRFNNATLSGDPQAVMERNQTLNFIAVVGETGSKKFTCYLPSLSGTSLVNYKQTCGALPSANPAVVSYCNIYAQTMDTSLSGSLLYDYEIHMDTIFEQPVVQNQS